MLSVIYPYVDDYARGDELRYSLRSLEKFLHCDYQVFVIGDKPEWLSDKATAITAPVCSQYAVQDVVSKMRTIINHSWVSRDFVWMNDDIYLLKQIDGAELCEIRAIEDLEFLQRKTDSPYKKSKWETFDVLKQNNLPTLNTATHLPLLYNKEKLLHILDTHQPDENGLLITLLYFNTYYTRFRMVDSRYKATVFDGAKTVEEIRNRCKNATWFNHSDNGHKNSYVVGVNMIDEFLKSTFYKKSAFEK